jgi:hypothetical protein
MFKNCQGLLIPIIMIFVVLLFTGDNFRAVKENFFGCASVPGTQRLQYFGPRKNFNIDEMCNNPKEKKWIPWPCYWRKNYNKTLPEGIGGSGLYDEMIDVGYHEPFKYDGVYTITNKGYKCSYNI